jgi:hypothetical protein
MQEIANTKIEMCCGNLFSHPRSVLRVHNAKEGVVCPMPAENGTDEKNIHLDSESYGIDSVPSNGFPRWIRIGAIAAASVLAGGLAVTWFYRKTVVRLRQAGENPDNPDFGIGGRRTDDEI